MKFFEIDKINKCINQDVNKFILESEKTYQQQLASVANQLKTECNEKPIILLSGPSGSGKTTTAMRIDNLLDSWGHETHTLSMDNYYLPTNSAPVPVDENGNIDYESPLRLDIELLNDHLKKIFQCEEVEMPIFDFASQSRKGSIPLKRKKGELIILEGIHALNPDVTGNSNDFSSCIYVSVRTRISSSSGNLLHPARIRLMRRLMRDKLFRGRTLEETISLFKSVSRGENLYIMPYKYRAKFNIDTFLPYEVSAYKDLLLPELMDAGELLTSNSDYTDILRFLTQIESLSSDYIAKNSLVREFIGGSSFAY